MRQMLGKASTASGTFLNKTGGLMLKQAQTTLQPILCL